MQVQFILEPYTFPDIINLGCSYGQELLDHVLYLTRTYVYYIHREREILSGRWLGDFNRRQNTSPKQNTNTLNPNLGQTRTELTDPNKDTSEKVYIFASKHIYQPLRQANVIGNPF